MRIMRMVLLVFFVIALALHGFFTVRGKIGRDTTPPVIHAETDEITVSVYSEEEEFLQGMSAEDNKDGDVTDSLVLVAKLDFIQKGTFKVNYAAFDSQNNVATYTRTATYSDYRSPRFRAESPLRYDDSNYSGLLNNIRVDDVLDGDLTSEIRITYGTAEGTKQPAILQVTNSAGDTILLSVNAYMEDRLDAAVPTPALDQYIVYTSVGSRINPQSRLIGYYQSRTVYPFTETSPYSIYNMSWDDSAVDYNTPGEYVIFYHLYSDEGELLGTTEQYVVVEGS